MISAIEVNQCGVISMVSDVTFSVVNAMTANHAERVAALNDRIDQLLRDNAGLRANLSEAYAKNAELATEVDRLDEVRVNLLDDAKRYVAQSYEDGRKAGDAQGFERCRLKAQVEIDRLNEMVKSLKGDLAKEQAKVKNLESREARSDMLLTYADAVIAAQYAVVVKFEQCHPESPLLQPSEMVGADGRAVSLSDAAYHQAFSEKFWQSGGTPEIRKQLGDLGVDLSSLDLAPLEGRSDPATPSP